MHDLHAADKVIKLVLEGAKANKLKDVKKIVINLGTVIEHGAEILPANLEFNIKMLAKNSIAEGLQVDIKKVAGSDIVLKEIEGDPQ